MKVGAVFRICHLNIEGISNAMDELLRKICRENVDQIAQQERHTAYVLV